MAPIHEAAMYGDLGKVKELLQTDEIDNRDNAPTVEVIGPATPLCYAAAFGNLEVARYLLKSGAKVTLVDGGSLTTVLHVACYWLEVDIVRLLLAHGSDHSSLDADDRPPLWYALTAVHNMSASKLSQRRNFVVWALLEAGAITSATIDDRLGKSCIDDAPTEALRSLLFAASPMHWAARNGLRYTVTDLLRMPSVHSSDHPDEEGCRPLHVAAACGWLDIVSDFMDNNLDVDPTDKDGSTPLMCAVFNGHTDIALLLLEFGANPRATNRHGNTPLHLAAAKGLPRVCRALIKRGADAWVRNKLGETPRRLLRCSTSEACYGLLHEFKMVAIASTDYCMRAVHQRGLTLEMIEQFANEHPEAWDRPTAEIVHDVIVPKTNRFFGASKAPKDGKEEDGTAGAGAAAAASAVKRDRQQERGVTKQSQALALMAAEKEHCVRKAPCRFTDVVEPKHVGMPDVFVVHAWTAPFGLLVAACRQFADCLARGEGEFGAKTSAMANVRHHFSEHPPEAIRFWIDIFAVMQCDGDGKEGDLGGIPASVSTSRFTLVVVDSATRAALRRMWCLYEIVVTASTQQQHPAGEEGEKEAAAAHAKNSDQTEQRLYLRFGSARVIRPEPPAPEPDPPALRASGRIGRVGFGISSTGSMLEWPGAVPKRASSTTGDKGPAGGDMPPPMLKKSLRAPSQRFATVNEALGGDPENLSPIRQPDPAERPPSAPAEVDSHSAVKPPAPTAHVSASAISSKKSAVGAAVAVAVAEQGKPTGDAKGEPSGDGVTKHRRVSAIRRDRPMGRASTGSALPLSHVESLPNLLSPRPPAAPRGVSSQDPGSGQSGKGGAEHLRPAPLGLVMGDNWANGDGTSPADAGGAVPAPGGGSVTEQQKRRSSSPRVRSTRAISPKDGPSPRVGAGRGRSSQGGKRSTSPVRRASQPPEGETGDEAEQSRDQQPQQAPSDSQSKRRSNSGRSAKSVSPGRSPTARGFGSFSDGSGAGPRAVRGGAGMARSQSEAVLASGQKQRTSPDSKQSSRSLGGGQRPSDTGSAIPEGEEVIGEPLAGIAEKRPPFKQDSSLPTTAASSAGSRVRSASPPRGARSTRPPAAGSGVPRARPSKMPLQLQAYLIANVPHTGGTPQQPPSREGRLPLASPSKRLLTTPPGRGLSMKKLTAGAASWLLPANPAALAAAEAAPALPAVPLRRWEVKASVGLWPDPALEVKPKRDPYAPHIELNPGPMDEVQAAVKEIDCASSAVSDPEDREFLMVTLNAQKWNGLSGMDAATGLVKRFLNNMLSEVLKRERETAHVKTLQAASKLIALMQGGHPKGHGAGAALKAAAAAAAAGAKQGKQDDSPKRKSPTHSPVRPKSALRREVLVVTPAMLRGLKEAKQQALAHGRAHANRPGSLESRPASTPRRLLDPIPREGSFHAAFRHAIVQADAQHGFAAVTPIRSDSDRPTSRGRAVGGISPGRERTTVSAKKQLDPLLFPWATAEEQPPRRVTKLAVGDKRRPNGTRIQLRELEPLRRAPPPAVSGEDQRRPDFAPVHPW